MTDDPHTARGAECQVCPVCMLLRSVRGTQPEVVDHLAAAARELALALRATLDAHRDGHGASTDGNEKTTQGEDSEELQRIRID